MIQHHRFVLCTQIHHDDDDNDDDDDDDNDDDDDDDNLAMKLQDRSFS
jgi:ligand-binding sensor protein